MNTNSHKTTTNSSTCDIWPFLDSPACIIHEANGSTFLAQPMEQSQLEPQKKNSIGIANALTGCVIREGLLVYLESRLFRSERFLCGLALSQEPGGQRRIAGPRLDLCTANKGIGKSTATAAHFAHGKSQLVLCTIAGEVLRYSPS